MRSAGSAIDSKEVIDLACARAVRYHTLSMRLVLREGHYVFVQYLLTGRQCVYQWHILLLKLNS